MNTFVRTAVMGALLAGVAVTAPTLAYADTPPTPISPSQVVTAHRPSPVASDTVTGKSVDHTPATLALTQPRLSEHTPAIYTVPPPPPHPFVFTYDFLGHLKISGGDFTLGGAVDVQVRYNTGALQSSHRVPTFVNPSLAGGAISVDPGLPADCGPAAPNGYVQGYDETTRTWTNRLTTTICVPFDDSSGHAASQ